eukprot:XP_019079603.1 PREDICTED: uncharacterized protein LOC109123660 [Vitis vinifera]
MALFDHFHNVYDVAFKPRLLRTLLKGHVPDQNQPLRSPSELSIVLSAIKTHQALVRIRHGIHQSEIRQGEDNVTKYFNSLKRIWQDLDLFNTYEWKSAEDGLHHKKTMEDNWIFKFLVGLNVEFDEVRGRIIGRQPLPSIGEVFLEVRREESWRNVMLGKKGPGVAIEGSALVTVGGGHNKAAVFQRKSDERPWAETSPFTTEPVVYSRKKVPRRSKDELIIPAHGQPKALSNGSLNVSGKVVILIVYVDDIVLTGDDCNELEKLKGKLAKEFEIKDLGALKYFLGMEFARSKEGIFVNQRKYVLDLLDETEHFEAVYKILRYLKGTPGRGLLFKSRGHLQIETYTNADWAGSIVDRRSTSGYYSFVGGNLVTWRSKKQNVVTRSSAEAEFRAVAHGICEIMWIRRLLEELKMTGSSPMKLYCDNKATISVAHNPVLHDRTKHVEVDKHFIKEKIGNGLVCMTYIPTEEQVADVFTKGLHKRQFDFLVGKLAMEDIFKLA